MPQFVVQHHLATADHYDFRLEIDGVFVSWAVPKGPSLDPGVRRMAKQVGDHDLDYGGFEGVLSPQRRGGGVVQRDAHASGVDVLAEQPLSVVSGRSMTQIEDDG